MHRQEIHLVGAVGDEIELAQQLAANYRTFPPLLSGVRAGTYNSWNISILKKTKIHEQHLFEYRAEFLNAFNHPSGWAPPNTSPTSSAFGRGPSSATLQNQK